MFTGIITAIGRVEAITDKGDRLLRISCDWDCAAIDIGASIACSGICLTVIDRQDHWFEVAASAETMAVTTLGDWQQGDTLNLERALRLGDELGGHIVTGHVDGVGHIVASETTGDSWKVTVAAPSSLAAYIATKGSITVDGISLTVNDIADQADGSAHFMLNIIPHTAQMTTLDTLYVGRQVNLEIDVLARYLKRMEDLRAR